MRTPWLEDGYRRGDERDSRPRRAQLDASSGAPRIGSPTGAGATVRVLRGAAMGERSEVE